jgi:hypothetical protein
MEKRMRLQEDVRVMAPPPGFRVDAELIDEELDQVVGGLERAWLPGAADREAEAAAAHAG